MRMKLVPIALLAASSALAHPGHGSPADDGWSVTHYLTAHGVGLALLAVLGALAALFVFRRRNDPDLPE